MNAEREAEIRALLKDGQPNTYAINPVTLAAENWRYKPRDAYELAGRDLLAALDAARAERDAAREHADKLAAEKKRLLIGLARISLALSYTEPRVDEAEAITRALLPALPSEPAA